MGAHITGLVLLTPAVPVVEGNITSIQSDSDLMMTVERSREEQHDVIEQPYDGHEEPHFTTDLMSGWGYIVEPIRFTVRGCSVDGVNQRDAAC